MNAFFYMWKSNGKMDRTEKKHMIALEDILHNFHNFSKLDSMDM